MKKHSLFMLILCLPLSVQAQFPGMGQGDMQAMMQQMQKMSECMAKLDQAELERLGAEGEKFSNEMKALCAAGKRSEAQSKAEAFGRRMIQEPAMKDLQRCSKMAEGAMRNMMPQNSFEELLEDYKGKHVCDEI